MAMLGPNPTHECFRLAAYYLTELAFQASGAKPLAWGEFMERYTAMYPRGQPGLPDDSVTAYMNNLRAANASLGSTPARRVPQALARDSARECFICVAPDSGSSSELEPAPRHRTTDAQHRARLVELAEVRRQMDEELANLPPGAWRGRQASRPAACPPGGPDARTVS
jgi:hypothetical protein